jgi:type IV pilus assembly protein PilC
VTKFSYTATTLTGETVSGVEKAESRNDAQLALMDRQLRNLQVKEKTSILQMEITGPRIKRTDVMHLSRQIAAFLRAGLPILDAVRAIGEESENSSIRRMMHDIEDNLRSGERFADCLERYPKAFPAFYRGIVRSAELTGELDAVLTRLAVYLHTDLEARRRIKSALIYPMVVAALSVVTVIVLAVYVLPQFKAFFKSLDAKLPLATRMLLSLTDFLAAWWWALLGGAGGILLLLLVAWSTKKGRYAIDTLLLKTPVLGEVIQYSLVERFCRVLGSMVRSGVNLTEALRVATDSLRNSVFRRKLSEVGDAMLEGEGLAGPLQRTGLFPGTASQMIRVGEETGSLDDQLEVTADYYEIELDYKIKKLTALFEPAVIIFMGVIVGFVAVALISAMYGVFNQVDI